MQPKQYLDDDFVPVDTTLSLTNAADIIVKRIFDDPDEKSKAEEIADSSCQEGMLNIGGKVLAGLYDIELKFLEHPTPVNAPLETRACERIGSLAGDNVLFEKTMDLLKFCEYLGERICNGLYGRK